MKRIVVPTADVDDWKRGLAKESHWKAGYSAMTAARAWEDAQPSLPSEVAAILESAGDSLLQSTNLVLAIPEYKVPLPGGSRASQTDVLALVRTDAGLVVVAVEAKVDETLGPTVGEKLHAPSEGVTERMAWLESRLGLDSVPSHVRYQLLHRTVSALVAAEEFNAVGAVMLVQSFSPTNMWFDDFRSFAALMGAEGAEIGKLYRASVPGSIPLFIGWSKGDQRFRADFGC